MVLTLGGVRYASVETEIYLLTTQFLDLQGAAVLSVLQLRALDELTRTHDDRDALNADVTTSMTLFHAIAQRHDLLLATWQDAQDGQGEREWVAQLIWGVLEPPDGDAEALGPVAQQNEAGSRSSRGGDPGGAHHRGGAGHVGDHSAWEAYNSVAESVDHDETLWRVRGSRAESLLDGGLLEVKDRVLTSLVESIPTRG